MRRLNSVLVTIGVACLLGSCFPSLVKSLQKLPLHEGANTTGPLKVTAAASVVYYSKGDNAEHPDTHYRIGVGAFDGFVETEGNTITDADIQNIKSITVYDATSKQVVPSDAKYSCGYNADKTSAIYSGFDCLIKTTSVGAANKIYFIFGMKDNTQWTSENLDLTKFVHNSDFGDELASIGETSPMYVCPDGKQTYYQSDCDCPPDAPCTCPAGSTFDTSQKKCITADKEALCPVGDQKCLGTKTDTKTDPNTNKDCPPPNFLDTAGKCMSILQTQKQCDANTVSLLDGTCGDACGANQVQKMGKCQCQTGYMKDTKGTGCDVDPNYNVAPPPGASVGGGSCSLIRIK